MKNILGLKSAVLLIAILGASVASAQVKTDPGVARISLINGDVSTQRGDSGDWAAAALNAPVVSGDKISTGDSSRAEVQLDFANIVRLGNRTQVNVTNLARTEIQLQIAQGMVNYTLFKNSDAEPEIDTPNVAIHPIRQDGSYRVTVFSGDETEVVVRKGEIEISTPQGSTRVKNGQSITVRGTGDNTQYKVADAPGKDDWDKWNSNRDNTIRDAQAWQHTDRYYVGSEDLDAYGQWTTAPDYGQVWVPTVPVGWVPYRTGRWVWEPYYGWTWVSYEPWGWAPYHYGRWFYWGNRWAWWPGPVVGYPGYRPIWAPAYVSFFGFGLGGGFHFGFSFGTGFGSVGWLPIGPCDRFYPWWGGYRNHFNTVNITNINVYQNGGQRFGGWAPLSRHGYSNLRLVGNNENIRRAVSTVPAAHFGEGRITPVAANGEMMRGGHVLTGNVPIVPSRNSLSASGRPANPSSIPRGQENNHFFSTRPAARGPQTFDRQVTQVQHAIERDGHFAPMQSGTSMAANTKPAATTSNDTSKGAVRNGNANAVSNGNRTVMSAGSNPVRSTATPGRSESGNDGWRRFGAGASGNSAQRNVTASTAQSQAGRSGAATSSGNRGWQRFSGRSQDQTSTGAANSRRSSNSEIGNTGRATTAGRSADSATSSSERGWQRFSRTPAADSNTRVAEGRVSGSSANARGWGSAASSSATENRMSRSSSDSSTSRGWGQDASRSSGQRYGTSNSSAERGWSSRSTDSSSRGSRPPLDMRQPIVSPRSSSGGGYHSGGGASRGPSGAEAGHGSSGGSGHATGGGGESRHR